MKTFITYINTLIQKRILLFFVFTLISIVLFVRLIGAYSVDSEATEFMVNHTYDVIKHVDNIRTSVAQSEAAAKSYLVNHDERWYQSLKQAQLKSVQTLSEALALIQDTTQKKRLKELEKVIHAEFVFQESIVHDAGSINEKTGYDGEGKTISTTIQTLLDQFMARQDRMLEERSAAGKHARSKALTTAVIGLGLFFIFISGTLFKLNKDVKRRKKAESKIRESESKYRKLIEEAGVTLFTCNLQGEFTYVSGRCESLTGYTTQELTGQNFATLLPTEWINTVAGNYLTQLQELRKESCIEFPIVPKFGGLRWVEQQAVLLLDEAGAPVSFQCVVKDITEKKEATIKLKQSEELTQTLLDSTREGFFMIDRKFQILLINRQAKEGIARLSGKPVEAGMDFLQFILPAEKEAALVNLERVFQGFEFDHETKYDTPSGPQWIMISHSPVKDADGNITGAAIVTHDITEKRKQEDKLRESDQKIRAMLESTREGFFMVGLDYSIMMMNEVGRKNIRMIAGREGQMGDNILDFIVPEQKEIFLHTFQKVIGGKHHETEAAMLIDAEKRWFHNSYFPVYDERNEVIGLCASTKDITEKKLVDNALAKIRGEREEYQYRLQSILDNTPLIIFIKDLEGRYLVVNKAFREMIHLEDEQIIGRTDFEIDTREHALHYQQADEEVIRTQRSVELEETLVRENGLQNLLLIKFPLFDKKNTIYGVGGIATDYTEKVQYRHKLIAAKKIAESAEQLQEQFLANMSHEIRTPMNGIIGMTNILMNTTLTTEQKDFVNIIKQSSDNLLFLINDILDLSKIKSGKLTIEKTTFALRELVDTVLQPFRIKAKEKNIALQMEMPDSLPTQLEGDPHRLNQILNNLLSNALKFTEQGAITLTVNTAEISEEHTRMEMRVRDTGLGIPADKLNSIFNSFEQATTSTTRKFGGTGLGLAITKQLVELQGGIITVASEPGTGTEFTFSITYRTIDKAVKPLVAKPVIQAGKKDLAGKKILVAEDNEINQKVIFHVLKSQGIETTIANNGLEAVTILEQGNVFDLIILDLQMPEMNGFQTATYVRTKLKLNIPIIAMTASALRNEKMKCFELGMNEYMTKPFAPSELFTQLRRFLFEIPELREQDRPAAISSNEYYDLSQINEMNDNQYFCEILQLFLETTPALIDEIKEATLFENWETVYKRAHKMKSSLGILQMNSLLEVVTAIETAAKKEIGLEKIPVMLKQVAEQYALIQPMIEAELNSARLVSV